ncbi:hypothetical protein C1646_690415 [Rhizophagus diaphanus]|nr:hypothetical protein C1646_690415 [Rhizophagus diaphanus] [Rhizophagus sp. MUCL 43196]
MNILSPKEFVNTFYKDIFQLLSKKFSRIGTKRPKNFREEVLRVYRQTDRSIIVFEEIAHSTCLPLKEILLLLESSVKVAHKIYMDNSKLQGRKEEILQKRLKKKEETRNKKENTPKNTKKGSRSQKKKRSEPILKIPILIENQDDKEKETYFFTTYRSTGQKRILGPIWPR